MASIMTKLIVTFLGIGYSPICPGTMASIATLPLWFLITKIVDYFKVNNQILFVTSVIIFIYILGYICTKIYIAENNLDDPSEVVIDEVVGQLLSFSISLFFSYFIKNINMQVIMSENKILFYLLLVILPIVLFRLFDITKPWIVGKVDSNMKNAHGIMLDDVIAGIFAGIINNILTFFVIKFFI